MNKSQLVDALTDRLGDRRTAAGAVDAFLEIVVSTVQAGESVSLAGFGVFESRARAARLGRNPRTGESVDVPATTVPAFRPGTGFRQAVAGSADAADTPRRRRTRTAGDTNGSLNGVVDAAAVPTTVLTSTVSDATDGAKRTKADAKDKGKKKTKASAKDDAKGKKGKKGKK